MANTERWRSTSSSEHRLLLQLQEPSLEVTVRVEARFCPIESTILYTATASIRFTELRHISHKVCARDRRSALIKPALTSRATAQSRDRRTPALTSRAATVETAPLIARLHRPCHDSAPTPVYSSKPAFTSRAAKIGAAPTVIALVCPVPGH